ncbi:hypothetical protein J6590_001076 [Homalodisca vitripennis]|nr:hypothetical protein J6590_001076 [Homalodisca vitripennis]
MVFPCLTRRFDGFITDRADYRPIPVSSNTEPFANCVWTAVARPPALETRMRHPAAFAGQEEDARGVRSGVVRIHYVEDPGTMDTGSGAVSVSPTQGSANLGTLL